MKEEIENLGQDINKRINGELSIHETAFGFSIKLENRYMGLFFPFTAGKIKIRKSFLLTFGSNDISYFKTNTGYDLKKFIDLSVLWLNKKKSVAEIKVEYPDVLISDGIEFLERSLPEYVTWKWKSLVESKSNPIDLRGYREVYDILYHSEISKMFPHYHGHEGLTVATYINKKTIEYSSIQKYDKNTIQITDLKNSKSVVCSLDNLYENYRKRLPEHIDWANYAPL